jgi:hypothetical protein
MPRKSRPLTLYPMKKLPKGHQLSQHLKEKSVGWFSVQLFGVSYIIPVSRKAKSRIVNQVDGGELEDFTQDVVSATYLRFRDHVASDVKVMVQQQIAEGFNNLLEKGVNALIDTRIRESEQKFLPPKRDKDA